SLKKGQRVIAQGRVKANNWTDNNGAKRHDMVLEVIEIGPSVLFGTVGEFTKTVGGGNGGNNSGSYFGGNDSGSSNRSEEHTSELQSRFDLVCRLLLEKKKTHT